MNHQHRSPRARRMGDLKRLFDLAVASICLTLAAPVMAGIAVAIYLAMGRPILFRQPRVGKHEDVFILLKFRTMRGEPGPGSEAVDDENRLTALGRLLRRSSLDELPQLWNVLRGDMSIVGPRALLLAYLPFYSPEQRLRHTVRPGITGWAQIHGRNAVTWEERLTRDVWYAQNHTIWLDLKIIAQTAIQLLDFRRSAAALHRPMPRFDAPSPSKEGVIFRSRTVNDSMGGDHTNLVERHK